MGHKYEQRLREIRDIFREKRPKPYITPGKKAIPTEVELPGPVKEYTEEEIFLYRLKTYNKTPFNFET